jgi:RNA polymerase sigma factor (sigma-70 family)
MKPCVSWRRRPNRLQPTVSNERILYESTTPDNSATFAMEQYAAELHAFLVKRLRRRQDADDLLQSIYMRFLQTPHTDLVRQPRAYLYRIATNMISEFNLRKQREPVLYDSDLVAKAVERTPLIETASDPFGDRLAFQEQLDRIVQQLPATYRAVLLLRVLHGASFQEIGAKFGITEQSARKYLVRAMTLLRQADWSR